MPTFAATGSPSTIEAVTSAALAFVTAIPTSVADARTLLAGLDPLAPAPAAAVIAAAVLWLFARRGDTAHRVAVIAAGAIGFLVAPALGALTFSAAAGWHIGGRFRGRNRAKAAGLTAGVIAAGFTAMWAWAHPDGTQQALALGTVAAAALAAGAAALAVAAAAVWLLRRITGGARTARVDDTILMPGTDGVTTCAEELRDPQRTFTAAEIDDALMGDQGGRCFFHDEGCTARMDPADPRNSPTFEGDHRVPHSKGGRTVRANLAALCKRCNGAKGDLTEAEARAKIATQIATGDFRGGGAARARRPLRSAA